MSGLLFTVCFVRPPEKLVSKTAPQWITFVTRRKKGLKGGMLQIHSATLQIARQENCLPARPFLPSFLSLSPSVCVGRSSSEARCKQGQCGGSPDYRESLSLDEVSLSFPGVSEVDGPHQSRSNIRQKQRRPSLPCSYFPFLSTRRRRGRHGQGRQVGHYPRAKTLPSSGTARQLSYPSPALHSKAWLGHNIITRICDGQSAVSIKLRSIQKKLGQQPCCDSERQESKGDCDRKRRGYSTRTK